MLGLLASFAARASLLLAASSLCNAQIYPQQHYHSSKATNVEVEVQTSGAALAPGYIFAATQNTAGKPMILTNEGDLIWGSLTGGINPRVQQYNGNDVLTVYVPVSGSGLGYLYGYTTILDNTYTLVYNVCPKLGLYIPFHSPPPVCQGDLHEQQISPNNTLLVTAYNVTQADLTAVGGPQNGWIVDGQAYELDIPTGNILWSWSSLAHVPITASQVGLRPKVGTVDTDPWDWFHINSIQRIGNQYLIDSRNTWAMYLVTQNGSIAWTFNGYNGGSFGPLPPSPVGSSDHSFASQHDARIQNMTANGAVVTLFNNDNNTLADSSLPSTGLTYQLFFNNMSCALLSDYYDPGSEVYSLAEGSHQPLPNGNTLIGYGQEPVMKEFGPSNTDVRLTMLFGSGSRFGPYRTYKNDWVGMPTTNPSIALQPNISVGYVSWNGATEVAYYAILAGTKNKLKQVSQVTKTGFETTFALPTGAQKYLQVAAYSTSQLLGKSAVTKITS